MSPVRNIKEVSDLLVKASANVAFCTRLLNDPCGTARIEGLNKPAEDVFCDPPIQTGLTLTELAKEIKKRLTY